VTTPPIRGRTKLAYDWLPAETDNLLDAGCAWGYATCHFSSKSRRTWGIDIDGGYIAIARSRYPNIEFVEGPLEDTPFETDFFDVIVMNDVLEHVDDETGTLNEVFRILRPGGTLIITVPHRGLFSFLDKANYGCHIRRYLPGLYTTFLKLKEAGGSRKAGGSVAEECETRGREAGDRMAGVCVKHRHYSLEDLVVLLRKSCFSGRFDIVRVFRSGLIVGALTANLEFLATLLLGKRTAGILLKPFHMMAGVDFCVPYGIFSYNIAVKLIKKSTTSN